MGLLTDDNGDAVSVQVYPKNTQEIETLEDRIKKASERFNVDEVTFVADKGLIKLKGIFQIGLFDKELSEIEYEGIRYILRRNPIRAEEISKNRQQREEKLLSYIDNKNAYLHNHKRADAAIALRDSNRYAAKLRVSDWIEFHLEGRQIKVIRNNNKLQQAMQLDGCYALKTDLAASCCSAEVIHQRYNDLALLEDEFKIAKTEHLGIRPLYLPRADRTKAHAFVVMFSLLLRKELEKCCNIEELTVNEGIDEVSKLCSMIITCKDKNFQQIPSTNPLQKNYWIWIR